MFFLNYKHVKNLEPGPVSLSRIANILCENS